MKAPHALGGDAMAGCSTDLYAYVWEGSKLAETVDALRRNARRNAKVTAGGAALVAGLAWGDAEAARTLAALHGPFDLVLGSDITFSRTSFGPLCATVAALLAASPGAAAVFALKERWEGNLRLWMDACAAAGLRACTLSQSERAGDAVVVLRMTLDGSPADEATS